MEKFLVEIAKYVPQYLEEFGQLLSGPKAFISKRNDKPEEKLTKAVVFLLVSITIAYVARSNDADNLTSFAGRAFVLFLSASLFSAAIWMSWRIVGGRAPFDRYFITFAYYFGVLLVLATVLGLVIDGAVKFSGPHWSSVAEQAAQFVASALIFGWAFLGWGAYREINQLTRGRSAIAIVLAVVNCMVAGAVVFFVEVGLRG